MDDNYDRLMNKINSKDVDFINMYKPKMLVVARIRNKDNIIVVGELIDVYNTRNEWYCKLTIDTDGTKVVVPIYDITTLNHADVLWAIANL